MSAPTFHRPAPPVSERPDAGVRLSVTIDAFDSEDVSPQDVTRFAERIDQFARELLAAGRTRTTVSVSHDQSVYSATVTPDARLGDPVGAPQVQASYAPSAALSGGQHPDNGTGARVASTTRSDAGSPTGVSARVQRSWDNPVTPRRSTPNRTLAHRSSRLVPRDVQVARLREFEEQLAQITDEPSAASPSSAAWIPPVTDHPDFPEIDAIFHPRVIIDLHHRRVVVDQVVQKLTYKEFELLAHLVTRAGSVISRQELFASVWRTDVPSDSRTIDVHVRRLRDKLGLEDHIITVRGAGYKFEFTSQVDVIPVSGVRG